MIKALWYTFISAAGIKDLDAVPETEDPEHIDVKTALFIYSLNSFIFTRINEGSRNKDPDVVKTLGPYAVLLTRIIDKIQPKR